MALPLEQFVKQLEDSGIIASETLKDFIPPKANPKNSEELARELVVKKKLTKFQANEAYQGKAKSLRLGNYTLLDKIGAGGMGQVFKAEHRRMKRIVAIKMLPPAVTKDAAAVARFQREVEAAAKLRHTNIVAADDADEAKGVHFLVMEYVEGRDLSALVKRDGPFPVDKAVNYVLQAARGLEFAHKNGVIHRDIKPANLLLGTDGTVKILDMGLARIEAVGDADAQAELTGTGMVMGTVDYMAPEQGMDTKSADARADIYSLGCTLHYLLIGKPVYRAETVMARMVAHLQEPIPNLCQLRDEVPPHVDAVFQKMVAKTIGDRYQSMTEVVAALERCGVGRDVSFSSQQSLGLDNDEGLLTFLRDIPVQTTHKPRATKPAKAAGQGGWKNKKPLLIGAGVLGVLALLAAVFIMLRTKDGTLIVEVNQPDSIVQVLSEEGKVEISQPGGLEPISISVVPGKHRIRVEKDGFATIADNIEIASGGKLDIKARLVPKAKQIATADAKNRPLAFNEPAFQQWVQTVATLTAAKQVDAVSKKLMELNPGFDGKLTPTFEGRVVTGLRFASDEVTDISPVRALAGLSVLSCNGSGTGKGKLSDLSPLQGMELRTLNCTFTQVSDLSPLKGMRLTFLTCGLTQVSDLSPLKGMPLTYLQFAHTPISDLSSLAGMKLTFLNCEGAMVSDLSPLAGMPLESLCVYGTKVSDLRPITGIRLTNLIVMSTAVTDLSPLRGMPLKSLNCFSTAVSDLSPLQDCKSLTTLNVAKTKVTPASVAALQKALPNCKIEWDGASKPITNINDPAFQAWMKTVAALPAEKQIEAVSKMLMELNPGFDGKLTGYYAEATPLIENGVVTRVGFVTDNVTDISPVRVLVGLKYLYCDGSSEGKGKLSDLSPLHGMKLTNLHCDYTRLSDLSPLEGVPLTYLACSGTTISDLAPLKGMPLDTLWCDRTLVTDLSTIQALPLKTFHCYRTSVSDLSPLRGMNLMRVGITPNRITTGLQLLRQMKSLTHITISDGVTLPAAEFWKKYDAGEFGKPAAAAKLAYLDPAFQQWVKATQALPAEKQIEAVSKKLMELNPGFDGKVPDSGLIGPPRIENGVVTKCGVFTQSVADISPVRAFAGLTSLNCSGGSISGSKLSDLSPLQGMPLTTLACDNTQVSDLSPLEGCKSLTTLNIRATKVTPASVAALQKALPNCKIDWDGAGKPAAGGGQQAARTWETPAFQAWAKATQALPAEKQIEAVSKKLMELNPGFDGVVRGFEGLATPNIKNGVVTGLRFVTDNVTDISPVRALLGLKNLDSNGGYPRKGKLADLSPLQGMSLNDLSFSGTPVSDLSPLHGMPLTQLNFSETDVSDLSPLKGMNLTYLTCYGAPVSDLSPLQGMHLYSLHIAGVPVADLSPLRGTALGHLLCFGTKVSDLTPLDGTRLTEIRFTPKNIATGLDHLRQMKNLTIIGIGSGPHSDFSPAEFWKKYDAGEFGKPEQQAAGGGQPAAKPKLAYLDPAFQQWVKATQALPAEKQIDAVSKKLMELNPGFDGKVAGYDKKGEPTIENGVVTDFKSVVDNVSDISPVRALAGLKHLVFIGSSSRKGILSDLSALQGMKLTNVGLANTPISDLSPLHGMPLTALRAYPITEPFGCKHP